MSRPQNSFRTPPKPQKQPIRAQKVKNDPNIKSKSNARVEGNIENESCSTTRVDSKTVFDSYPKFKNKSLGLPKVLKIPQKWSIGAPKTQKLPPKKSNSKVRIEGIIENKLYSTI